MLNWIKEYIAGPTHKWWVDNVWRPSWTKFVTFLYGIPAALLVVAEKISDWAKDDTIATYIAQVGVPNWVPSTMAAVALVYYIAHGRD